MLYPKRGVSAWSQTHSLTRFAPLLTPTAECMGIPFNYYYRFMWMNLVTLVLLVSPGTWYVLRRCGRKSRRKGKPSRGITRTQSFKKRVKDKEVKVEREGRDNVFEDTVILLLLTHPLISGLAAKMFQCNRFTSPSGTVYMLASDYSIECYDSTWTTGREEYRLNNRLNID